MEQVKVMQGVQCYCGLFVLVLMLSGCAEAVDPWKAKRPATVPAKGMITYKDQPLSEAVLVFYPTAPQGIGASALTDKDGNFDIKTFPPTSGIVPGSYTVSVMKVEDPKGTVPPSSDAPVAEIKQVSVIPVKYNTPAKSGLTVEVKPDGNDNILLQLKD
jgi:hypothetical protein